MAKPAEKLPEKETDESLARKLRSTNKAVIIRMCLMEFADQIDDLKLKKAELYVDRDSVTDKLKSLRDTLVDTGKELDQEVQEATFDQIDKVEQEFDKLTERAEDQMDLFRAEAKQADITDISSGKANK